MAQPENLGSEIILYEEQPLVAASTEIEPQWEKPSDALQIRLPGAYLGRLVDSDGWNAGYRDSHEEEVPDAGVVFVVSQSSMGGTYLSAKAMEGHRVEALNPDASSRRNMWIEAPDNREDVLVDSDWGKTGSLNPSDHLNSINFGNPGTRSGIVRVTGPDEKRHYYLMGANFEGQPDSWYVEGALCEVTPNEQLELMITPRQLTGTIIDSSILSNEVEKTTSISAQTIDALQTAFEHDTPEVNILSADRSSAYAAKTYAEVTIELLLEIARQRPDVLDGTEEAMDVLGRRAKLITHAPRNSSYLSWLASDEENRVTYLKTLRDEISIYEATSNNAHNFTFLTKQALSILKQGLASGADIEITGESPLLSKLHELIAADQQRTAEIETRRVETLKNTILNPEWEKDGVSYGVAIPGQKVEIDLSAITPLLTAEQTRAAFFTSSRTDSGSVKNQQYNVPTIAIVDFDKNRYAITEASADRYGRNGSTSSKRVFNLLRIVEGQYDPRNGVEVKQRQFGFGGEYDKDIQVLFDPRQSGKKGHLGEVDAQITIEYDAETNKLIIQSTHMKAGVLASKDGVKTVAWQPEDAVNLEKRREIRDWQKEVKTVERETEMIRVRLEQNLADKIASGQLSGTEIQSSRSRIEEIVSRGVQRSYTYNGYRGDKWHRAQTYYVTVDEGGNVWGDFERGRLESGITGRPVAPGKHIIRRNPMTGIR